MSFLQIALGISVAAGVRVGSALGAGNPISAKTTIKIALGLTGNANNCFVLFRWH